MWHCIGVACVGAILICWITTATEGCFFFLFCFGFSAFLLFLHVTYVSPLTDLFVQPGISWKRIVLKAFIVFIVFSESLIHHPSLKLSDSESSWLERQQLTGSNQTIHVTILELHSWKELHPLVIHARHVTSLTVKPDMLWATVSTVACSSASRHCWCEMELHKRSEKGVRGSKHGFRRVLKAVAMTSQSRLRGVLVGK